MQIYSATQKGPLKAKGYLDPDDVTTIQFYYGAPTWVANTVYLHGQNIKPTIDNGYYYTCTVNGKSGIKEPTWTQDDSTIVGTAIFAAVPYDLWLLPSESIANSTWTSSDVNMVFLNESHGTVSTNVVISNTSPILTEFELTNHVVKNTGDSVSKTVKYMLNQQ